MRVLLVDDDQRLAAALTRALTRYGVTVRHVTEGRSVLGALNGMEFVLLDLSLPDMDGIQVCRTIRAESEIPIIMLTGRGGVEERVLGLQAGADDYVVKPFNLIELMARIQAVCRRRGPAVRPSKKIHVMDVDIDLMRQTVTVAGTGVSLSRKEFQVLALLAGEDGAVCSRDRLVTEIWGQPWRGAYDTLNVHVATLRSKIGRPEIIETVRGVGYRLSIQVKEAAG